MKLIIQDSWAKEGKIFHKTSPPFSGLDFTWERQKGSEDAPINPFQMVIIRLTSGWVLKYLWSHLKTSKCTQCTLGIIDINQFYGAISSYISGRSWINLSRFPFDSLSKFFSNVIEYETPKVRASFYQTIVSGRKVGREGVNNCLGLFCLTGDNYIRITCVFDWLTFACYKSTTVWGDFH